MAAVAAGSMAGQREDHSPTNGDSSQGSKELVGSDEDPKNWKGIVISLVVIVSILAMIVLAIALITDGKKKDEPGDPLTFDMLTNPLLHKELSTPPDFHFTHDGQYYVTVKHRGNDKHVVLVSLRSEPDGSKGVEELLPYELFQTKLKNFSSARLSPDKKYILLKIQASDSASASYRIYKVDEGFIDDSHFKDGVTFNYISWIGDKNELLYIKDNTILYRLASNDTNPTTVSSVVSDKNLLTYNGVPDQQYQEILKRQDMVWISPNGNLIAFGRLTKNKTDQSPLANDEVGELELYLASPRVFSSERRLVADKEVDSSRLEYLKSVSWIDSDELMVVWIDKEQQVATYLVCSVNTSTCSLNYEYHKQSNHLHWTDVYQTPVFSADKTEFYTILPDPENELTLHTHIAAIKLNPTERKEPKINFLTKYPWSDNKIILADKTRILYTSTGSNYTHRHLYSLSLEDSKTRCLTCQLDLGVECLYIDAVFNKEADQMMLSCLGPDIPSYHVLSTDDLLKGNRLSSRQQIAGETYQRISNAMESIKLPTIEYYTVALDDGLEASIKLQVPAVINRTLKFTYGLVIILNDGLEEQGATQAYPDLFTTYLSKNQSHIVANVDVRGSANRGARLTHSVYGGLGVKEANDIQQIIRLLKQEHFKINDSKIAVLGFGYGGLVALHAAKRDLVTCAVAVAPLSDLNNMDIFPRQKYLPRGEIKASLELNYRCNQGDDCKLPKQQNVLIIHGIHDKTVNYKNSLYLVRELQLAGYEFRQQIYPQVGHNIKSSKVYKHYYQTVTNYLSECFAGNFQHRVLVNR